MRYLIIFILFFFYIAPAHAAEFVDSDNDGLSDQQEIDLGTDPNVSDTDGDGFLDGKEIKNGFSPFKGERSRDIERRVEVDLATQTLKYFANNVVVGTVPVSSGLQKWATPTGEFKVQREVPVKRYTGANYDYPNTKWNIQFKPSYYLHGAYWHDEFGKKPMSHGCVNMRTADAEKLFYFLDVGDTVKVFGKTPVKVVTK